MIEMRLTFFNYVWADGALSPDSHFFRKGKLQENMFFCIFFSNRIPRRQKGINPICFLHFVMKQTSQGQK